MYGFMLFIHLTGLAIWLGSLVAVYAILLSARSRLGSPDAAAMAKSVIRVSNILGHPSAFLVLVSGLIMFFDRWTDNTPFWMSFMQMVGGTVIILSLIVLSLLGRRAANQIVSTEGSNREVEVASELSSYLTTILVVALLIVVVILVVAFGIGSR